MFSLLVKLTAATLVLVGCSEYIHVISVYRSDLTSLDQPNIKTMSETGRPQDWQKFTVLVNKNELVALLTSESTVYIEIMDCASNSIKFPSIAFFEHVALDEQQKLAAKALSGQPREVEVAGYAPTKFLRGLKSICVRLGGGNYITPVRSNLVAVS